MRVFFIPGICNAIVISYDEQPQKALRNNIQMIYCESPPDYENELRENSI